MSGKKMDAFWRTFNNLMAMLPGAVDECVSHESTLAGATGVYRKVRVTNGDVVITGPIKSIRINGYLIRVPAKVMEGSRG